MGVIHGIRIFLPVMLKQDYECHIINISSIAGLTTYTLNGIYAVTKHRIVAFSETLSNDLKVVNSKIKVSVLCPEAVLTNISTWERNRPVELRNQKPELDVNSRIEKFLKDYPKFKSIFTNFLYGFALGILLDEFGDIVFEAIKDKVFHTFTNRIFVQE